MNVTNFTKYRDRNKPISFRVGTEVQARRRAHIAATPPARDFMKWRKRMEAMQCQK